MVLTFEEISSEALRLPRGQRNTLMESLFYANENTEPDSDVSQQETIDRAWLQEASGR